jgi:hypothetical protein
MIELLSSLIVWNWWTGNGDWWGFAKDLAVICAVVVVIRLLSEIANLLAGIHEILSRVTGGPPTPSMIVDEYLERKQRKG